MVSCYKKFYLQMNILTHAKDLLGIYPHSYEPGLLRNTCELEWIAALCLHFLSYQLAIATYFSLGVLPIPHFMLSLKKLLHPAGQSDRSLPLATVIEGCLG